jgi:hypothetical protein
LFVSCKSNKKQAAKDTTAISKPIDSKQSLVDEFKPIIQGSWVNKEYIDEIARTKSPYSAQEKMANITTILIDTKFLKRIRCGQKLGMDLTLKTFI